MQLSGQHDILSWNIFECFSTCHWRELINRNRFVWPTLSLAIVPLIGTYFFISYFIMYMSKERGQTTNCAKTFDVNRNIIPLCQFLASFKAISLWFKHVFSPWQILVPLTHECSTGHLDLSGHSVLEKRFENNGHNMHIYIQGIF